MTAAVYYPDAKAAVEQYGDALSGKVVVDITNPVNETYDDLVTPPYSSAAQDTLREGEVSGQRLDAGPAGQRLRDRPQGRRLTR